MQVGSCVSNRYYTPYQTNTSVKYCAGFSQTEDGKLTPNETTENPGFAEFVDYQEFHKAWMSQGAETAFSYTKNNGFNSKANSISLVPGMSARLSNGFRITISDYMVQALGDFKDNQAASESAAVAGALNHLIKVANGQIPMNMFYSKNQDNSDYAKIGLQAFGIDTSRPFTINEKTFHFDSDGQIRLGSGQYVNEEYQANTVDAEKESEDTVNTDIDFSRFAPNAPKEVKQAFMEAAEENGYNEGERMDYLSQVFIHQVENRQNSVANYTDVFGSSVASALQAAREILHDLENPLMPVSQRGENAAKYVEQEKKFYRAFIEKLEGLTGADTVGTEEMVDYAKILEEKIKEIFVKIQNGDTEPTYQIGSQSFTEKEWEEFLDKFDSVEEAIQELMKEEQTRKEAEEAQKEDVFTNDASTLLTTESTSCVYETADPDDDDIRYITWYTEEGIFCRKAGQTEGYEWAITFENMEQYDKVMEFIGQFPSDWNMRFTAHENFWNDFLNDEIDMDAFMEFINGTDKGVPDYSITIGDSMYIDKDKMQWAKYTNPLGTRLYTAEEMHQMQMEIIEANQAKLTKLTDWDAYEEMYKKNHPEYNGEKICCEYPGGSLYTVKEMAQLQYRKMLESMGVTEEEMQQRRDEWRKQMGYPGY